MLKIKNIIVKNSIFSVLQIVLSTLSYVVIYYLILHKLGKTELGVWSIITSLPIAISVFGSGVSGCVLRYIPVYNVQKDRKAFNEIIFNGFVFNIVFGGLIVALGFLFTSQILHFIFSVEALPFRYILLFRLSLLTFFVSFISSVILFAIDGLQLIFLRNKIVIFSSVLFCIMASVFINYWDLKGILIAQFFQALFILLFSSIAIFRVKLFDFSFFKLNKFYFKLFFTYGQGFQFISITVLLFEPITKYFLNKYFNLSVVGVYDLVSRAVTQIRILIVSAVQVITPLVSKSNEESQLDVNGIYRKTIRGASLLSFVLYSSLICSSMIVVGYFDRVNINQYLFISILLCVSYHFNIRASISYSILMGLGNLKSIIISHVLSSALNILLFLWLGKYLMDSIIALPTSLAIIISSEYLIYNFKNDFKIVDVKITSSDIKVKLLSIISVVFTVLLISYSANLISFVVLFVMHSLLLFWLIMKNDFFINIFNKILNK
jgi:O-antigen/teichoic acid export membrane protein